MNKKTLRSLVFGAVIAAAYTALTFISSALGLAFGPIQLRFSEALCVLPIFTPAGIWGLTVGCLVSNLASPLGLVDIIFGTTATLLASVSTYLLRNAKPRTLSLLPPVLFNAVIIGAELYFLADENGFLINALLVGLGEIVSVSLFGLPLCKVLEKHKKTLLGHTP